MTLMSVFPDGQGVCLTQWDLGNANAVGWLCSLSTGEGWTAQALVRSTFAVPITAKIRMGVAADTEIKPGWSVTSKVL